ncbi:MULTISPECIES: hypothetical protein [unclassified Micromonospora]|uniref:hypothetical protein n=1 Tax=unclassified Micromonospora TaxID=2617518 RepID=UPI003A88F5A3
MSPPWDTAGQVAVPKLVPPVGAALFVIGAARVPAAGSDVLSVAGRPDATAPTTSSPARSRSATRPGSSSPCRRPAATGSRINVVVAEWVIRRRAAGQDRRPDAVRVS